MTKHRRQPRHEEAFAFEVIRRVLGAEVEPYDDNSEPSMVDAHVIHKDGTLGALEATTLGDRSIIEAQSLIVGRNFPVDGAQWAWHAAVSYADAKDFRRYVPQLVLACEEAEVGNVVHLDDDSPSIRAALEWAEDVDLTLVVLIGNSQRGTVFVASSAIAGFVDESLPGFAGWLEHELVANPVATRSVEKLRADGRARQHLFIRVHTSAMPEAMFVNLTFYDGIPNEPLTMPAALTDVWLAAQWMKGILHWNNESGWRREVDWHDETFHDNEDRHLRTWRHAPS